LTLSSEYFRILKNSGDRKNWSKQIEYAAIYPGLNEGLRARLVNVLIFFESELGKGFLKTPSMNHPIHKVISNKVVSSALWLIDFGELLQDLKESDCNYAHLFKKIMPETDCEIEGIPFAWISKPYLKNGFDVKFIVENLDTVGKPYADIELTDKENGQQIIIEVSTLNDSDKIKNNSQQYSLFSNIISHTPPVLVCSGKQITTVPENLIEFYCGKLEYLKQNAISTNKQQSLKDQYFELVIHPEEPKSGILYQGLQGQETSFDFTDRIISSYKIHHEAKQIPKSKPGLIYLKLSPLFFWSIDVQRTISKLKDHISKYNNLFGLVLYGHMDTTLIEDQIVLEQNGDRYQIKNEPSNLVCHYLFVKNSQFDLECSTTSLRKLMNIINQSPVS
jgi:hypothetical protein